MSKKISASLMCVNPYDLKETIENLESNKIDFLHLDLMDGHFVPNIGFSIDYINLIRKNTNMPCDFHLMIENPLKIIPNLHLKENDLISIHFEATYHLDETLDLLKNTKAKILLALKPNTPLKILDFYIDKIDGVNFLTIIPGFYGQKILDSSIEKFNSLIKYLTYKKQNLIIQVDGNMSFINIPKFKNADIFVAGTSSIFPNNKLDLNNLNKLKNLLKEYV